MADAPWAAARSLGEPLPELLARLARQRLAPSRRGEPLSVWIVLTFVAAAVLHLEIAWRLCRLGSAPVTPKPRTSGIRGVLARLRGWTTGWSDPP